jgi:5-methylcytosine-specific restriction endonuclease McrA
MTGNYGSTAWRRLSAYVTQNPCGHCGSTVDLLAHHKHPVSMGGTNVLSNLESVCRRCHQRVEQADKARVSREAFARVVGPPRSPLAELLRAAPSRPAPRGGLADVLRRGIQP